MFEDGTVKHYEGTIPPLGALGLIDGQLRLWKLDELALQVKNRFSFITFNRTN